MRVNRPVQLERLERQRRVILLLRLGLLRDSRNLLADDLAHGDLGRGARRAALLDGILRWRGRGLLPARAQTWRRQRDGHERVGLAVERGEDVGDALGLGELSVVVDDVHVAVVEGDDLLVAREGGGVRALLEAGD